MKLEKLFNPSSIAIIGATDEEGKVGKAICENILNLGYSGKVFLVNPKHQELFGQKCYSKLEDIEEKLDLAIIVIPAKFVSEVIKNSSNKAKDFVIISAGFSETGEEGKKREEDILKMAKENNLNILGPNCLGFIVPKLKLNASFAGGLPEKGNISFISQSGALISALLDISKKEALGFSNIISIGNKMEIGEADLLEYLISDENTKLVAMYLEGIKDGKKFKELAEKISKTKPVIILKAGKTEKSQKAISSHTGALAGSEDIVRALFRKAGVIEAENFDEFLNLIKLISKSSLPENQDVIAITNAGGPGVLTTDAFSGKDLKLLEISEDIKNNLQEFLPKESSLENPIDLLGDAKEDRFEKTLEIIEKEKASSIITILTPQENTPLEKITEKIIKFKEKTSKTVVAVFLGGEKMEKAVNDLNNYGIPNFSSPEKAVNTLSKYSKWGENRDKIEINKKEPEINQDRIARAEDIIAKAKSEGRNALYFKEAKSILDLYEINSIEFQEVNTENELEIDFPMVMKVDSEKVLHKTDKQALVLNIKNEDEFRKAYQKMSDSFPKEKIIIQPMQKIQTELIIGIKRDESIGPVVVFGLGGIYTEVFKMVEFVIPPSGISEIKKLLIGSPIRFLFQENRGQRSYDLEEIARIIQRISLLADEVQEIKELDINPLLVYNNGDFAIAVDIKIII